MRPASEGEPGKNRRGNGLRRTQGLQRLGWRMKRGFGDEGGLKPPLQRR